MGLGISDPVYTVWGFLGNPHLWYSIPQYHLCGTWYTQFFFDFDNDSSEIIQRIRIQKIFLKTSIVNFSKKLTLFHHCLIPQLKYSILQMCDSCHIWGILSHICGILYYNCGINPWWNRVNFLKKISNGNFKKILLDSYCLNDFWILGIRIIDKITKNILYHICGSKLPQSKLNRSLILSFFKIPSFVSIKEGRDVLTMTAEDYKYGHFNLGKPSEKNCIFYDILLKGG